MIQWPIGAHPQEPRSSDWIAPIRPWDLPDCVRWRDGRLLHAWVVWLWEAFSCSPSRDVFRAAVDAVLASDAVDALGLIRVACDDAAWVPAARAFVAFIGGPNLVDVSDPMDFVPMPYVRLSEAHVDELFARGVIRFSAQHKEIRRWAVWVLSAARVNVGDRGVVAFDVLESVMRVDGAVQALGAIASVTHPNSIAYMTTTYLMSIGIEVPA